MGSTTFCFSRRCQRSSSVSPTVVRRETVLYLQPQTQAHAFLHTSDNLYCQAGAEGFYTGTASGTRVDCDVDFLQARDFYAAPFTMDDHPTTPK